MIKIPIRTAVAGIGGYARAHHDSLWELEKEGLVKVVATCDPNAGKLEEGERQCQFAERGVEVYTDFEAMIEAHGQDLDLVTVAAPIRFHAPMHRACVERGLACYLEKPPTLDPEELEEMIALDATAPKAAQVGFNYIYQPYRLELKRRILDGEFGALKRISFEGHWPRALGYYSRNTWAGRLLLGDYILLDSCCGNAMSHHLQNILFFGGEGTELSWASPKKVEAELYRANDIEGTDTIFARGELETGVEFRIAASHACLPETRSMETIVCEEAEIAIDVGHQVTIRHRDGRCEQFPVPRPYLLDNLRLFCDYLLGKTGRPVIVLEDCRAFVRVNALFYAAAGRIQTVAAPFMQLERSDDATETRHILGIKEACARAIASGEFPSEQGLEWSAPGGSAVPEDLAGLRGKLKEIQAARPAALAK